MRRSQRKQLGLRGANGPTLTWLQIGDERALNVELADVAILDCAAISGSLEPADREALSAAHIGPTRVDPAGPLRVEECARPRRMGLLVTQELALLGADPLRLDLEHGDVVDTATAATPTAL